MASVKKKKNGKKKRKKRKIERGIEFYPKRGAAFYRIDIWLQFPDGSRRRKQVSDIPTLAAARKLRNQLEADAFSGRYFPHSREHRLTLEKVWESYRPVSKRDNDTWQSEEGRARVIMEHLGHKRVMALTRGDVERYRNERLKQKTRSKKPPKPATLDKEVELLKRMINFAVSCGDLPHNPIAAVKLLRKPNTRDRVVTEAEFDSILEHADNLIRPILLVAYDTGMRKGEILGLKWSAVDLDAECVRLSDQDTKTERPRTVYLTPRVIEALESLSGNRKGHVFRNPRNGKRWHDVRTLFYKPCKAAGIKTGMNTEGGVIFHDLRRSFVTNARRRGIAESVVMRMSGHKTRNVFDRYNIVNDDDVRDAVSLLVKGREKEVAEAEEKCRKASEEAA